MVFHIKLAIRSFVLGDIIIERWIPYGAQAKRKTIVQRAAAGKGYPKPRNIIIIYEPIQVRVIRQFQRLGVTQENPQLYIQRYGQSLLDPQVLVQRARAAGVIEDIVRFHRTFSPTSSIIFFRHHLLILQLVQDSAMRPTASNPLVVILMLWHPHLMHQITVIMNKNVLDYQVLNLLKVLISAMKVFLHRMKVMLELHSTSQAHQDTTVTMRQLVD